MKVLFVNTVFGKGSTGRIVKEIGEAVEQNGGEYRVAYGRGQIEDKHGYRIGNDLDLYTHAFLSRITDRAGFYSKGATKKLIKYIKEYSPDVIHLHNLHGYYLHIGVLFDYLKNEYKGKIVWTLHDCWAFTGHCTHFSFVKCNKWKTQCNKCPLKKEYPSSLAIDASHKNYTQKKQLMTGISNIHIVTVSKWLADITKESFLGEYPIHVIYNGIKFDRFHHVDNNIKQRLKIDGKMILSVSDGWTEKKGFSTLLDIAKIAPGNWTFVIIGLDKYQFKNLPSNVIGVQKTWNQDEIIEYYSAADVFYNPSVEETFGLVTVEAMACGTPAVVMNSTACPEVVFSETCGRIVEVGEPVSTHICAIEQLIGKRVDAALLQRFSIELFIDKYLNVFYKAGE